MQDSYPLFNKLESVRASSVTKKQGKRTELHLDSIISDCLSDGEEVLF